jgi:hypothetical protein
MAIALMYYENSNRRKIMGYYTKFTIKVSGADNENQMTKFAKEMELYDYEIVGENGPELFASFEDKWYDWKKDFEKCTKNFPRMLVEIEGKGEDAEDIWMARIRDGESEIIYAKIVFDEFKKIK